MDSQLAQEIQRGRGEIRVGDTLARSRPDWATRNPDLAAMVRSDPERVTGALRSLLGDPDRATRELARRMLRQIEAGTAKHLVDNSRFP
jgi:alpha-beta hydrolase superfamily lysophospholipase